MPRSFLVRKYYRRYDDVVIQKEDEAPMKSSNSETNLSWYPSQYLKYARSLLTLSQREWDYEFEKSYWFDTTYQPPQSEINVSSTNNKVTDSNKLSKFDNKSSLDISEDIMHEKYVSTHDSKGDANKVLTNELRTSNNHCDTRDEDEHIAEYNLVKKDSAISNNEKKLAWENLEEKITRMLGEDTEVVAKNIRQFLDNNRIPLEEIAAETSLDKDEIQAFMEFKNAFNKENKRDFYRWYLAKILRPPNENSDESYTCYKCGKIFTYKSYLERHIKYVCPDSTGRTWKCTFCGKAFQYPCYLRRHIRSHTGESPYKCDKCDRAFVRSTDLQRHIRNHTGEKPYRCTQCSRAFARSTDLKRHMRTHTGEKPYKCWQCGKSFSQSGSLQTHLNTHNKEVPIRPKKNHGL